MTGALIGFGKGLCVGVLALSFLGADLYIISGDNGTKPMESYKIDNPDYDYGYQVYQEICQYGNYGIFQLLNIIKDKMMYLVIFWQAILLCEDIIQKL